MKKINFIICLFLFAGCNPDKPTNDSKDSLLIGEWIGGNSTKAVKTFTLTIRADKTYEALYRATNPREYDEGTWSYDTTTQILAFTNKPAYKLLYVNKDGLAYQEVGQSSQYIFKRK